MPRQSLEQVRAEIVARRACLGFLVAELLLLRQVSCVLCLGAFAWDGALAALRALGEEARPRPRFRHGGEEGVGDYVLLGCYHPSQQNTFTGRLTAGML